jgi:hypothetical protein
MVVVSQACTVHIKAVGSSYSECMYSDVAELMSGCDNCECMLQEERKDVKKESTGALKTERSDDDEKLAAADNESMDACMKLLYSGGEGNIVPHQADTKSADSAQEGAPGSVCRSAASH